MISSKCHKFDHEKIISVLFKLWQHQKINKYINNQSATNKKNPQSAHASLFAWHFLYMTENALKTVWLQGYRLIYIFKNCLRTPVILGSGGCFKHNQHFFKL